MTERHGTRQENYHGGYTMSDTMTFPVIVAFFVLDTIIILIVVSVFFLMLRRLAASGGFPAIQERWPAESRPPGTPFYRQNVALNKIWYKNTANLIVAGDGLHISFGFPVSLSLPQAALIPWKYVRYQSKSRAFWTEVYEYRILMEEPVILTVRKNVATSFPEHLKPGE